jgi:hypothetical protein
VYFLQGEQLVAVDRPGEAVDDAVAALVAGPTDAEASEGLRTYVPASTPIADGTIERLSTKWLSADLSSLPLLEQSESAVLLRGASDLVVARPARPVEGAKRLEHRPRGVPVPLRRHRQGLVEGAAAVRARPGEARHEPGRVAARVAPQQLDDRGRAPNRFRRGRYRRTSSRTRISSASMRMALRGSW